MVWKPSSVLNEGDTADAAFGTAVEVTDAGGLEPYRRCTNECGPASTAVTIGGSPADDDTYTFFQVYRDAADVSVIPLLAMPDYWELNYSTLLTRLTTHRI